MRNLLLKVVDKKFTNYLKSIVKLNIQGFKQNIKAQYSN